jgi:hypothetical protein
MKQLINCAVIAAAIGIFSPVAAQAQAPSPPSPPAPAAPAAKMPMAKQMHHARPMRHAAMHHPAMDKGAGDRMTDQLNREELARITGGSAPMAAPAPAGH